MTPRPARLDHAAGTAGRGAVRATRKAVPVPIPGRRATEALLAAVRELGPELLDDPGRLSVVADALTELTDVLVGVAAAGKLTDETLRALAALDAGASRLAATLRSAGDDGPRRPVGGRRGWSPDNG